MEYRPDQAGEPAQPGSGEPAQPEPPEAPDVLGRKDAFVRLVIGELLEGAAAANLQWGRAVELRDRDPDEAMTQIAALLD